MKHGFALLPGSRASIAVDQLDLEEAEVSLIDPVLKLKMRTVGCGKITIDSGVGESVYASDVVPDDEYTRPQR